MFVSVSVRISTVLFLLATSVVVAVAGGIGVGGEESTCS